LRAFSGCFKPEWLGRSPAPGNSAGVADPVGLVRDVKALAERAGGLRKLKQLVDILAE
jgi:hypothetical protein